MFGRRRKTKFPTVYPTVYLLKLNFEYSYPLIDRGRWKLRPKSRHVASMDSGARKFHSLHDG